MSQSRDTSQFAIDWSEELCDLILDKAADDDVEPEIAVYGALAAAIVLARSVGMRDAALKGNFKTILETEFPEAMLGNEA